MSKTIDVIQVSNDTFSDVFATVSLLANAFLTTVTVAANSTGELTTGNGFVVGTFGANTLVASTLRGGNVSTGNAIVVASNLTINGASLRINSNVDLVAASLNVSTNSTVTVVSVQSNSSMAWLTVGGATTNITSNVIISGRGFRLPTGNTLNRPAAAANGFIRFNDETSLLEMYVTSGWQSFVAYSNTFSASAVAFVPAGSVAANNVQAAIVELDSEKLALAGGTLTGNVVINRNGLTLPTSPAGTVLQIGQPDANNVVIELDSFEAFNQLLARRTAGGNGSRAAIINNDVIFKLSGAGYDGTSYGTESISVQLVSDGSHNTTSKPTKLIVQVTAAGSNTPFTVSTHSATGMIVNGSFTSNTVATANVAANNVVANNITISANLVANGALLTDLNANNLTSGTVPAARIPAANSTSSGGVLLANISEFRAGTSNTKVLTPGQVFGAAGEITLAYSGSTIITTGDTGLDMSDMINAVMTLTQNSTLGQPQGVKVGQSGCIRLVQDATGSRTLSFHADWEFAGGTAPTVSTAAGSNDLLFYHCIASGRVFGSLVRAIS